MCKKVLIICLLVVFSTCAGPAWGDIYMYIDSSGVVHFTNVPTSSDYKLYIKEQKKKAGARKQGTSQYDHIIKRAHQRYGVDFSLIKAVIAVESDFNPRAVSKKGARGLMQIMPDNYSHLKINDPFNPTQNIMGGTLYLQRMLKRYHYKLPLALAAYNAGPTAVDKYNRIPPYQETQNYVKKVMKTYSRLKQS